MRLRAIPALLLAIGTAACAAAGGAPRVAPEQAEREVLMMIIRENGRGAVLLDSTYGHRCMERRTRMCDTPPDVPVATWESYLRAASAPAALRDLLPADVATTYASTLGDESARPCRERREKLQLSRAGISPDGRTAIVSYSVWMPMDHLGCGAVHGATLLLRRAGDGAWEEDRPLSFVRS